MTTFTLGLTDNDGCQNFALGWLDSAQPQPQPQSGYTPQEIPIAYEQLKREDDEIMLFITAFMELLD